MSQEIQAHYWVHFVLAGLMLAVELVIKCCLYFSETSLAKTRSFFESSWQLEIPLGFGMWVHILFASSMLGLLARTFADPWDSWLGPLQTLYVMPQSLCIHMCDNPDIYGRPHFFALMIFLCPFLYSSLTMRESIYQRHYI